MSLRLFLVAFSNKFKGSNMAALQQLPVRFDEAGDEVEEDEVLTAMESYERLLSNTKHQLFDMIRQTHQYDTLIKKLKNIRDERTREVMVPVANGLGYFRGTILHTNEVMVLLGNNWFAERSVSQGIGIAERRVEFLKRETKVLEEQVKSITSKQNMFVASSIDEEQQRRRLAADTSVPRRAAAKTPTADSPKAAVEPKEGKPIPASAPRSPPNTEDRMASSEEDEEGYDEEDVPLIEPEDELTLQELAEIEAALGDDIEDEVLAERAILDKIAEKRRKRLRLLSTTGTSPSRQPPAAPQSTATTIVTSAVDTASSSSSPQAAFLSPSDIGRGFAAPAVAEEEHGVPQTKGEEVAHVPSDEAKRVRFVDPQATDTKGEPLRNAPPPAASPKPNPAQTDRVIARDSSSSDDENARSQQRGNRPASAPRKKSKFATEHGI